MAVKPTTINQKANVKKDDMILSIFNNTCGGSKSTMLYTLLIYMNQLNRKREIKLYDLYNDSILFERNDSVKHIYNQIENYDSLNDNPEREIYNCFSELYSDNNLYFFNSVGKVGNSDSMILLYSKFIIIPVVPTYYYLNNIYEFILMLNKVYQNIFIPNEEIVGSVKEYPVLIFVPMHTELPNNVKEKLQNSGYGNGNGKMFFVGNVYPFLDYSNIVEYDSDIDSIDAVNESVSKLIFSL